MLLGTNFPEDYGRTFLKYPPYIAFQNEDEEAGELTEMWAQSAQSRPHDDGHNNHFNRAITDDYEDECSEVLLQLTQPAPKQKKSSRDHDNSIRNMCEILMLPNEIPKYYEICGIRNVYDWQLECLTSTGVANGRNLLYCAPTGGGKSLVAELVLLMNVIVLKKKALFILPYVSLVVEKERQFKAMAKYFNKTGSQPKMQVKSYYGDKSWHKHGLKENIIICTVDKANNLLATLADKNALKRLGCVVIDEIHMIGGSFNGYLLEILIRFYNLVV